MLVADHESVAFERRAAELPCRVRLPEGWIEEALARGPMPVIPTDARRHVRFYFRTLAVCSHDENLPLLPRAAEEQLVFTKNLSKEGVAFLHAEQMFPGERLRVWFPDGRRRSVQVVRCTRMHDACYEIGVRFVSE